MSTRGRVQVNKVDVNNNHAKRIKTITSPNTPDSAANQTHNVVYQVHGFQPKICPNPTMTKKIYTRSRIYNTKRSKKYNARIPTWSDISLNLLSLVLNNLNYQERIKFRVVCKSWNVIQNSIKDVIHDLPLQVISLILMKTASRSFKDFFNFFIYWIKVESNKTVKALLEHMPIHQLYLWGDKSHKPDQNMFTYFMSMAQGLGNKDAEFYWPSKSIILRHHIHYDILENSYNIITNISAKGHALSILFKNMLDIYFIPKKRKYAVKVLIDLIISPKTKDSIPSMVQSLTKIGGEIYPEPIFGPLSGQPICSSSHANEERHYKPDGYPVQPDQMTDYECLKCKVSLLLGCLSAYRTESTDYYLDFY